MAALSVRPLSNVCWSEGLPAGWSDGITILRLQALGADCLRGDIRDFPSCGGVVQGVDTVFHTAALAGIWGKWQDYYSINVQGTENVLQGLPGAAILHTWYIPRRPPSSSIGSDICNGDESLPYATEFLCHYARSKVMAEKMVLAANWSMHFSTCAIRPHLIWGPGDPHLIPRLLASGRKRLLKKVGTGTNMVDISYVDNVAYAHVLAADNLLENSETAAGKAYFINQDEACLPVGLDQCPVLQKWECRRCLRQFRLLLLIGLAPSPRFFQLACQVKERTAA